MDAIQSFMQRRRGLDSSASLGRDQGSLYRRSRSIGGVRNVATDAMGKRMNMPTTHQIRSGRTPDWFKRSMAPNRADNVKAAMENGTFGGIRSKFNQSNAGRQVMEADGSIRDHNPYKDGGQAGAGSSPTPPAGGTPTAPTPAGRMVPGRSTGSQVYVKPGEKAWFENSPAAGGSASQQTSTAAKKPTLDLSIPSVKGKPHAPLAAAANAQAAQPAAPLPRTGRIIDETGDVTSKIMDSMTKPASAPDPVSKQAASLTGAATTLNRAEDLAKKTQGLLNKSRAPGRV